jgi:predicted ribosomally synthesized peptide with SipW-like signal peptide
MKSIIKSLVIVIAIAAVASVATWAYFADQETVSSTFSSGKLDVELRGDNANGITIPVDTTQTFEGGMAPGVEFGPYEVQVYNKGWGQSTLPVKYAWSSNYMGGNQSFYNMIDVKVREGNCDWLNAGWFAGQGYIYTGKLNLMPTHLQTVAGLLHPNITRCTWFYFTLDPMADNNYQGLTTNFNLVLDATQNENPGWNESGT